MARKKHEAHENHERWLVSYADFITLLFAFFVVMFASTQSDKTKAKEISEAVEKALSEGGVAGVKASVSKVLGGTVDDKGQGNAQMKGPGGAQKALKEPTPEMVTELIPSLKMISHDLQSEIRAGKLEVRLEPRGLVVSLRETTLFPSGEATIQPSADGIVEKIAHTISLVPTQVLLEGHTDSIPISTPRFASNWELSAARSIAVLNLLTAKYNIPEGHLAIAGYADISPMASNDTPEGRARNRRVDVVFLSKLALSAAPPTKGNPASPKAASGH